MTAQLIGFSGSPIKNSNTDRLVQAVLSASGLQTEFIKLAKHNVRPCIACLGCTADNVCKVEDDFPILAERIKKAHGMVIGTYPPYAAVDGFTKALLERLFSMRHQNHLNRGKLGVVVATGIGRGVPGLEEASQQVATALSMEGMEILGQLKAIGNAECMVCGYGEECPMSALPWVFGSGFSVTQEAFCRVEDQPEVWEQAHKLGHTMAERIRAQTAL